MKTTANRAGRGLIVMLALLATAGASAEIRLGLINDFEQREDFNSWWNFGTTIFKQIDSGGPDGGGFLRVAPQAVKPEPDCTDPVGIKIQCGTWMEIDAGHQESTGRPQPRPFAGDYLDAGVRAIRLTVRNSGSRPAPLRLAFSARDIERNFNSFWWVSKAIVIAPNSGWQTVTFSLAEDQLQRTQASPFLYGSTYQETFSLVGTLRILTNPSFDVLNGHRGEQLTHIIDLDKITALDTPPAVENRIIDDGFE